MGQCTSRNLSWYSRLNNDSIGNKQNEASAQIFLFFLFVLAYFFLTSSAGLNIRPSFSWLSFGLQCSRICREKKRTKVHWTANTLGSKCFRLRFSLFDRADIATRAKEKRAHTMKNAHRLNCERKRPNWHCSFNKRLERTRKQRNSASSLSTALLPVKRHTENACSFKEPALLPVDVLLEGLKPFQV